MDRKDVDTAVAENTHLRGLFNVVGGMLLILMALLNADWGPSSPWFFGSAVLVLGLAALAVWRYYNANFGHVTPSSRETRRTFLVGMVGILVMVLGSFLLSSRASWSLDLPVNAIAMGMAVLILLVVAATVRIRTHHVVIYGSLFIAGAIPVWERDGTSGNTGLFLAGIAMIAGGLLDHRLLVKRFGSVTALGEEDDRAGTQ